MIAFLLVTSPLLYSCSKPGLNNEDAKETVIKYIAKENVKARAIDENIHYDNFSLEDWESTSGNSDSVSSTGKVRFKFDANEKGMAIKISFNFKKLEDGNWYFIGMKPLEDPESSAKGDWISNDVKELVEIKK